jgi:hypothetical protein
MENQKMEFRSFLSSMYDKLENLKHSDFDEEDLTQLETAFKMECERFSTGLPIYARRTDIVRFDIQLNVQHYLPFPLQHEWPN